MNKFRIAVIGYGHWGKNYVRILSASKNVTLVAVAEFDDSKRQACLTIHPRLIGFKTYQEMIDAKVCDAVVVATPASTHDLIVQYALEAGLDVLSEKPFTLEEKRAQDLTAFARKHGQILMVAHTFLFNASVQYLKELYESGALGKLYYIKARRTHFGLVREDVNAVWDLAPHDISILLYLLGEKPEKIQAMGRSYLKSHREDIASINLQFGSGVMANILVSWIDTNKERILELVGSKMRVVFDDLNIQEPIKIYFKGAGADLKNIGKEFDKKEVSFGEFKYQIRDGDILCPQIAISEPLGNLCNEFIRCVETRENPYSDGFFAQQVTQVLVDIESCLNH